MRREADERIQFTPHIFESALTQAHTESEVYLCKMKREEGEE